VHLTDYIRFPTKQLILEGPDLVGKTTAYNEIHKMTNFKWNIQDRSSLSMLCYAKLYGRDTSSYRRRLYDELNDLNNRMIVFLPPFDVIEERYNQRGDELQDIESLKRLYQIFSDEAKEIQSRPTVMCLREEISVDTILDYTSEWSYAIESSNAYNVGEIVRDTLHADKLDELSLRVSLFYEATDPDFKILKNENEGVYFTDIKGKISNIIKDELLGNNEYGTPQTLDSRRFYYNSSTCISSIHLMPRGDSLTVHACLRSTDVDKNAPIDLEFLEFLTQYINKEFQFKCKDIVLNVTFNSAHIRRDLEKK